MAESNSYFKRNNIFFRLWARIVMAYKHMRYPQSIWFGGSIPRETALKCVGPGWSLFINQLYDAKPKRTKVWQVKEKYAGLRFYISSAPRWYNDLISYYEHKSYETCEQCGNPGVERTDLGWYLTLCDEHYAEEKARRGK